jgi:predicted RNase H-like nuclease
MRYKKKSREGHEERLAVLRNYFPEVDPLFDAACRASPRKDLARDDILDALVVAVTARGGYGAYATLPATPEQDATGLPMEIVYWQP